LGRARRWAQSYARVSSALPTRAPRLVRCPGGSAQAMLGLPSPHRRTIMGKYLLAWLLGVPGIVLLLVYLFFH